MSEAASSTAANSSHLSVVAIWRDSRLRLELELELRSWSGPHRAPPRPRQHCSGHGQPSAWPARSRLPSATRRPDLSPLQEKTAVLTATAATPTPRGRENRAGGREQRRQNSGVSLVTLCGSEYESGLPDVLLCVNRDNTDRHGVNFVTPLVAAKNAQHIARAVRHSIPARVSEGLPKYAAYGGFLRTEILRGGFQLGPATWGGGD